MYENRIFKRDTSVLEDTKQGIAVHNEYSISSGVTRKKSDDLHRVPFRDSPLGSTDQYFNFSIDLELVNKIIKLAK